MDVTFFSTAFMTTPSSESGIADIWRGELGAAATGSPEYLK
jgi:hypothetical protein